MGSSDSLPLTPDYIFTEQYQEGVQRSRSMAGHSFQRVVKPPQRLFHCLFNGRGTADKNSLWNFYREMEATYFVLEVPTYHVSGVTYVTRHFPVEWAGPPKSEWSAHENYSMECDLIEAINCPLQTADYPDPDDGHPTATIAGTVSGADKYFVYAGYGFTYTGTGTLTLDGVTVLVTEKLDVPLGLHYLLVTGYGGAATLEVVI